MNLTSNLDQKAIVLLLATKSLSGPYRDTRKKNFFKALAKTLYKIFD